MTRIWLPQFVCPECRGDLGYALICIGCRSRYERRDRLWRFLSPARQAAFEPFARQYRQVRDCEGYRTASPDFYRRLPWVAPDEAHAAEWRVRQESYDHFQREVLTGGEALRVLDLGAGSGWLSNRLASLGHRAVAVDAFDDECDGLGAIRHFRTAFAAVQADFSALPFAPAQFDVVVFNGSLHYARDVRATLDHARTMLVPGGRLVVMDSPMFRRDTSGRAMLEHKHQRFTADCGLQDVVQPGVGYLTFVSLDAAAARWQARSRFISTRGSLDWCLRRHLARVRLRRAPAAFGVWVAR